MNKYVALLRGINVAGKNKVPMSELKEAFEKIGFSDVKTYINSGNVIFSSEIQDNDVLTKKCEAIVAETFALNIPIAIITDEDLSITLDHAPTWWNESKDVVHYAIFLIPPISVEEVFDGVGKVIPEYEQISYHENVIYWSASYDTFSKSRWSRINNTKVSNNVTLMSANTVKKLYNLTR